MNRRKLNQEKSRNVPEPFSKELEDWMVGELKGVELSKRDKIVFSNVDLKRKLFQTPPPWCHSHWPKYSLSWEILKLKLQHEKSLLLRGEEKTKAATELQRVKSLGCSVYCHGWVTRVVIQCSDTGVHTCVCGRQCRAHVASVRLMQTYNLSQKQLNMVMEAIIWSGSEDKGRKLRACGLRQHGRWWRTMKQQQ